MSVVLNDKTDQSTNFEQTESQQTQDETNNSICRIIVDPEIEKQIVLDELSADAVNENKTDTPKLSNVAGREFPIIRVGDFFLTVSDIQNMTINIQERIPTIEILFTTPDTNFRSKNMPKDGDIISIFIAPKSETLSSIRNDYVITYVNVGERSKKGCPITVFGNLFIPGFDADAMYGTVGTSKSLFKETAKKYGLGFATDDEEETDDSQLWICYGITPKEFLNNSISHTWKDEMSFFDWWIDQYYNLNFINVNKIILENSFQLDVTAETGIAAGDYEDPMDYSQDKTKMSAKLLSNIETAVKGTMYVEHVEVFNNSTAISFENGVEIISNEFYHNSHIYENEEDPNIILSNVPAYNQDLVNDHILLRGRAAYDKETSPENEQAKANYNYKDIYIRKPWCGVSYVISDGDANSTDTTKWSGNVSKNYTRSAYHNKINLSELDKLYIKVRTRGLCTQIMRGEVVPVALRMDKTQEMISGATDTTGLLDRFYNGFYYVDSISYGYHKNNKSKLMEFDTTFTLKRREWPIPVDYKTDNNNNQPTT